MTAPPEARSKKRPPRRSIRRQNAARLAAVQALYQIEFTGAPASSVVEEFSAHRIDGQDIEIAGGAKANGELFAEIVREVRDNCPEIDTKLGALIASNRSVESLEIILRCILRAGYFELSRRFQAPARSVVQEYVRIADSFYSGDEPGLVNGVLDRAARELRPGELESRRSSGDGK